MFVLASRYKDLDNFWEYVNRQYTHKMRVLSSVLTALRRRS
jgi:hypothetical protein